MLVPFLLFEIVDSVLYLFVHMVVTSLCCVALSTHNFTMQRDSVRSNTELHTSAYIRKAKAKHVPNNVKYVYKKLMGASQCDFYCS